MSSDQYTKIPVTYEPNMSTKPCFSTLANFRSKYGCPLVEDLSNKVDRWIGSLWNSFDDDYLCQMHNNMFSLLPIEWNELSNLNDFHSMSNPFTFMQEIERNMCECYNKLGLFKDEPMIGHTILKDSYQVNSDGNLCFNAQFNVEGFEPSDIKVTCNDDKVLVQAKQAKQGANSKCHREFCRMIHLPISIKADKVETRLTENGVLTLEAPVKKQDSKSIRFVNSTCSTIQPRENKWQSNKKLCVRGKPGLTILDGCSKCQRMHIEVAIDPHFKPKDISISVNLGRIHIVGKRQPDNACCQAAEFKQSYVIPANVHLRTIDAAVIGGTLVVDASITK